MARRMSAAEHTNVLLEDIRAQNRATYEGVTGAIEGLERRLAARFESLEERVTMVENAVRQLLTETTRLSNEIADLRGEVNELRADVNRLRHDFDNRNELSRLDELERRVALLEERRSH